MDPGKTARTAPAGRTKRTGAPLFQGLASLLKARRSLSGRLMLVVLTTTAIALLAAGAALLFLDLQNNRAASADDLATEAAILSLAVQPALSFDDLEGAQRNLNALRARSSIEAATLYLPDGTIYAAYAKSTQMLAPARAPLLPPGVHVGGGHVELTRPVTQNGETLGTIYLRAEYDVSGRVRAYISVIGSMMFIGLIAGLLASSWLQRAVSEPLESMANAARKIVEQRDYSFRAMKATDDETGVVIDAFNKMLDEVELRSRALEQSEKLYRAIGESINYGVWVCDAAGRTIYVSDSLLRLMGKTADEMAAFDWTNALHPDDAEETLAAWKECVRRGSAWYREHRMLGADGKYHAILAQGVPIRDADGRVQRWAGINLDIARLKSTERALLEADRRKDEFLATLAHELRNPLAPIRNAVMILDSDAADVSQRKWGREVIARQVQRMSLLLDDLLDVSRITRGVFELKKDYVELKWVVNVAVETARPLIDSKHHKLSVKVPDEPVMLEADPLRLSQVIGNLLTNAAKYTDRQGRLELEARVEHDELVIVVRDNGIGLSDDALPTLFTMFSQVNSAIDRAEGGLGIGLALVKGLVTLHGGHVEVFSAGLGRGSEFTVRLPHKPVVPASVAGDAGAVHDSRASRERTRVLVVDDNRDSAESLGMVLELAGYSVATAFSGADALALGARERPRAAVVDIGMPGMSGHEVARRMRREAWGRNAVLIALTGFGQDHDKQAARAAGFDEHLTKPVDPEQLGRMLAKLLDRESGSSGAADANGSARA
ncbi:MAG TPA: ATP-binding protein [Gammaproteobacteria bacterium]|nr:ATP-binding protein [Gammaproteobacteria bacterium]